jgi:hypothetical protein
MKRIQSVVIGVHWFETSDQRLPEGSWKRTERLRAGNQIPPPKMTCRRLRARLCSSPLNLMPFAR